MSFVLHASVLNLLVSNRLKSNHTIQVAGPF
ncbi:hypothetical protein Pan189_32780 [Stratiformator vulcanicus]|uniref:Uncharacterized protein n=1 Tax=Stratiformator vulcanicus TaxID=2527980 RepID=A0A517R4R4_9PLAN|nr:hypothetical protein Pan189_32780 [Stratiformator vulcanicus]